MSIPHSAARTARQRPFARVALIAFSALALMPLGVVRPSLAVAPDHLVVSEVVTGGSSASDELIEIYNPSAMAPATRGPRARVRHQHRRDDLAPRRLGARRAVGRARRPRARGERSRHLRADRRCGVRERDGRHWWQRRAPHPGGELGHRRGRLGDRPPARGWRARRPPRRRPVRASSAFPAGRWARPSTAMPTPPTSSSARSRTRRTPAQRRCRECRAPPSAADADPGANRRPGANSDPAADGDVDAGRPIAAIPIAGRAGPPGRRRRHRRGCRAHRLGLHRWRRVRRRCERRDRGPARRRVPSREVTALCVTGSLDDRFAQRTLRAASATASGGGDPVAPAARATGEVDETVEGRLVRIERTHRRRCDRPERRTRVRHGRRQRRDARRRFRRAPESTRPAGPTDVGSRSSASRDSETPRGREPRDTASSPVTPAMSCPGAAAHTRAEPVWRLRAPRPTPTASGSPAPGAVSTIAQARAAAKNARLTVRGLVTLGSGTVDAQSAVIQDATGAMLSASAARPGRCASASWSKSLGARSTKSGMESLRVSTPPRVLGTGPEPTPRALRTGDAGEGVEAQLVVARGALVAYARRASTGTVSFEIDDGSGPLRVVAGSRLSVEREALVAGRGSRCAACSARRRPAPSRGPAIGSGRARRLRHQDARRSDRAPGPRRGRPWTNRPRDGGSRSGGSAVGRSLDAVGRPGSATCASAPRSLSADWDEARRGRPAVGWRSARGHRRILGRPLNGRSASARPRSASSSATSRRRRHHRLRRSRSSSWGTSQRPRGRSVQAAAPPAPARTPARRRHGPRSSGGSRSLGGDGRSASRVARRVRSSGSAPIGTPAAAVASASPASASVGRPASSFRAGACDPRQALTLTRPLARADGRTPERRVGIGDLSRAAPPTSRAAA